jgi:hypothetical protein
MLQSRFCLGLSFSGLLDGGSSLASLCRPRLKRRRFRRSSKQSCLFLGSFASLDLRDVLSQYVPTLQVRLQFLHNDQAV